MKSIRVRVGGVYVRGDEILLVRHQKDGRDYWLLPGGGCEFGESLARALERELKEEAGIETRTGRLLFINESIPPDGHRHGLNLTFLGEVVGGGQAVLSESSERLKEVAWRGRDDFEKLTFFPNFKKVLLKQWESGFILPPENLGNLWDD